MHTPTKNTLFRIFIAVAVAAGGSAWLWASSESVIIRFIVTDEAIPITVIAIPEKRIPTTGNYSTRLRVAVRPVGTTDELYSETVITTDAAGSSGVLLSNVSDGFYDITAKGYSHLTRKISNVLIESGAVIDFTDDGDDPLLSGDVNGASGDDKVNGIDLSLLVGGLSGGDERLDLNQDTTVNGIDLTNAVTNLNVLGDE